VYVSSEAEKGSLGGREEGDSGEVEFDGRVVRFDGSGGEEVACGSLSRRITWVMVGWKIPPYLE